MVMISDGNDPSMGIGNNVCFCYEDMQWTTGDASYGEEGFGGTPATVGINAGNGTDYFQIGRFDSPGAGETGIDLLDHQSVCFSTTGITANIPPIALGVPNNNTIDLECGETISDLVITFSGPEEDQTVNLNVSLDGDLTIDVEDGVQTAKATINWTPSDASTAFFKITATDNLMATTVVTLTLTYPGPCQSSHAPSSGKCELEGFVEHQVLCGLLIITVLCLLFTTSAPSQTISPTVTTSPSSKPSDHPSVSDWPTSQPSSEPTSYPSTNPSKSAVPSSKVSILQLQSLLVF